MPTRPDSTEFLNHTSWSTPGSYDGVLLQPLRDCVLHDSDRDLFIVLHLMGSHQRYDFRYPDAYQKFRPLELKSEGGLNSAGGSTAIDRTRNSYDNSILYTDHILASVIGILRKTSAVTALWYESDHGESAADRHLRAGRARQRNALRIRDICTVLGFGFLYRCGLPGRLAALRANADQAHTQREYFRIAYRHVKRDIPGSRLLMEPVRFDLALSATASQLSLASRH